MTMGTDLDLGRAFREAERVARLYRAIGPSVFRSTDGWEVSGSVARGGHRVAVRVVRPVLEDALLAWAERVEWVAE